MHRVRRLAARNAAEQLGPRWPQSGEMRVPARIRAEVASRPRMVRARRRARSGARLDRWETRFPAALGAESLR